ncbi:MAG: hypothetical protein AB1449_10515 [Chloroflexota bacterium]
MPRSPVSLEQLRDYVYCSMLFYWKHVARIRSEVSARTTLELAGEAVRQAWRIYADRPGTRMAEAVMMVWRTWLARESADGDDVLKGLAGYAQAMAGILRSFESGKVRKADGSRYKQPRMSHQFTKIARSSGMPALAAELDRKLVPALRAVKVDHPQFGPYSVADAFTDSIRMAERLNSPAEAPRPEAILAVDAKVQVRVGGWVLLAVADMLVVDDAGEMLPSVFVELHDYDLGSAPLARTVGRDLRMIAAAHMVPLEGGGLSFGAVSGVTYRHIRSGWTHRRRMAPGGRLTHVLEAALRGIQEGVYIPMFLTDLSRCDTCVMKTACFNPGGLDALEALAPGLVSRAEAVGESVRAVAAGLGPTERKQLVTVLRQLAEQLARRDGLTSDLAAAAELMAGALQPVGA